MEAIYGRFISLIGLNSTIPKHSSAIRRTPRVDSLPNLQIFSVGVGVLSVGAVCIGNRATIRRVLHGIVPQKQANFLPSGLLPFASTTLALTESNTEGEKPEANVVKESQTGLEFPVEIDDGNQVIAGLGIRNKVLFGLKNLKIYAYGVYVNPASLKEKLGHKYSSLDAEKLKSSKWLMSDVISEDTELTVRLVIFYKGLKIGQVRHAFEDSLGNRILAIKGSPQPELLNSFTKQFDDHFKLERGTTIEISRKPGHVLVTKIGGEEVGSIKSSLMAQAFFDLYLGNEPFDKKAKGDVVTKIAESL